LEIEEDISLPKIKLIDRHDVTLKDLTSGEDKNP
jgi:hypothetical protein